MRHANLRQAAGHNYGDEGLCQPKWQAVSFLLLSLSEQKLSVFLTPTRQLNLFRQN